MTKKVVRLARLEGGVVVSVDDLQDFLADMISVFEKEDDALGEKLKLENWHWPEKVEPPKALGMSMFAGQVTVLAALNQMLTYWKESEVKTGDTDEAGKVLHVPEGRIV